MKKLTFVILVLLIGLMFIGCSKKEEPTPVAEEPSGTVRLISAYDESKVAIWEMYDKFRTDNPKINLEISVITSSEEINKQLMILAAADTLPDIVSIDGLFVQSFAAMGILEDITDRMNNDLGFSPDLFYPAALNANILNGKYYGVPLMTNCLAIFYNKTILDQNGIAVPTSDWTWDDFADIAQKATRPREGIFGAAIAGLGNEQGTFHFYPWFWSAGGDSFTPNSEAGKEALAFISKMIADQSMSRDVLNFTQADAASQFFAGKIALASAGCWNLGPYQKIEDFEWGVVPYPKNPRTGQNFTALGGRAWNIIKGGNVEAAWAFIKYMSASEVSGYFCPPENYIPSRKDVTESISYYTDPKGYMSMFTTSMTNAKARGPHYFWLDIDAAYGTMIQQAYSGMDINTALEDAQTKVDRILKR